MQTLGQDDVHVCYAYPAQCLTRAGRSAYLDLLSEEELQSLHRFTRPELQDEYLLTRALCRTTLSLYADVSPQQWRFERSAYGRPFVVAPACGISLNFNLSNSRSLVAMAVTCAGRDVGIDVETMTRTNDTTGIAESYFSPRERADLADLPEAERRQRFFTLWTLKESYIKARGMGLSLPLDSFSMQFDADGIGIALTADGGTVDPAWQFMLTPMEDGHMIALCAARLGRRAVTVWTREVVPGT